MYNCDQLILIVVSLPLFYVVFNNFLRLSLGSQFANLYSSFVVLSDDTISVLKYRTTPPQTGFNHSLILGRI